MSIFTDYKEYQKYLPEYNSWKDKRNLNEAKKLEYFKQNPCDSKTIQVDFQRGRALLNAIDIMDEYSQSKAENMEVLTDEVVEGVSQISLYGGMIVGGLLSIVPPIKGFLEKIGTKFETSKTGKVPVNLFFTMGVGLLSSVASMMMMQGWAASKQVAASRDGRFEAMQKELQNVNNFAVLTDEQIKIQEEIASKIPTTKDMKKGNIAKQSNLVNPLTTFKMIGDLISPDSDFAEERKEFDEELNKMPEGEIKLSEQDILNAKKDQQLLLNIAEKVDMASQDYAENTELVVGALTTTAFAGGFLTGYISNKIIKALKVTNQKVVKFLPPVIGVGITLGLAITATFLQKQAARVGRFKAKQELEKNPDNFIYLNQEKIESMSDNIIVTPKEKPNLFTFTIQAIKDNLEYKKYLKTCGIDEKKKQLALKKIDLSKEQIKEAKRLQKNTFKVFNKIDEKSQRYAESVEAVGATIAAPIETLSSLLGLGLGSLVAYKSKSNKTKFLAPFIGAFAGVIPAIIINAIFTKKEKEASRVAHMLAMNEMSDYKKFVDYDNIEPQK